MANEFIIKNGAFVSGSLTVSQSLIANTIQADNIVGNLEYVNISASNTLTGKRVRIDADNYLYLNGSEGFPYFGYNPTNNRIILRGVNVPGIKFQIALDTQIDGNLSANTLTGSLDYDQLENVPGFVDSTGNITQNNIAVFAESAQGLPTNLPFSLPLYNDGNATIRAFEGLSYTSSNLTVDNSITLTPTQSSAPSFEGVDGQMVVGMKGAAYAIYVWLGGGWRSGSLT